MVWSAGNAAAILEQISNCPYQVNHHAAAKFDAKLLMAATVEQ